MIFNYDEDIQEITEEEITEDANTDSTEDNIASETDALLLHISQSELDEAVTFFPKMYDLFSLWFLLWLGFQLLSRIRVQFRKHTGEMRDKE